MRVRVRPAAPGPDHDGSVRERVRAALRCPFCRDDAPPARGALACARRGCGALYHEECWAECAATYGGCAVFGCGSRVARGVGRAGLLLRALRLLLAAALFPRRALEALRRAGDDAAAVRRALRAHADHMVRLLWTNELPERERAYGLTWFLAYPLKLVVLAAGYGAVAWLVLSGRAHAIVGVALLAVIPALLVVALRLATWPLALALEWARAVLAGEFAALTRAAEGTVLARLRAAPAKGK